MWAIQSTALVKHYMFKWAGFALVAVTRQTKVAAWISSVRKVTGLASVATLFAIEKDAGDLGMLWKLNLFDNDFRRFHFWEREKRLNTE